MRFVKKYNSRILSAKTIVSSPKVQPRYRCKFFVSPLEENTVLFGSFCDSQYIIINSQSQYPNFFVYRPRDGNRWRSVNNASRHGGAPWSSNCCTRRDCLDGSRCVPRSEPWTRGTTERFISSKHQLA